MRDLLAHNIALRNPLLSQRELNSSVQLTIDRIIFLRICEDRGIEFYGQLRALLEGREAYTRLGQIFRKADDRYIPAHYTSTVKKIRLNLRTYSH